MFELNKYVVWEKNVVVNKSKLKIWYCEKKRRKGKLIVVNRLIDNIMGKKGNTCINNEDTNV